MASAQDVDLIFNNGLFPITPPTNDFEPPSWSNQGQSADVVSAGETVLLYALLEDDIELSRAILSTNETGEWINWSGRYASPSKIIGSNVTWVVFPWRNSSITPGTTVGWKIWFNDAVGKYNVTQINSFTVKPSISFLENHTHGTIWTVCTAECNFTRIQDAVDSASANDTIFVYNGTYTENVTVWKPITIIGESPSNTIIAPLGLYPEFGVKIPSTGSGANISNFTITNSKLGIWVDSVQKVRITNTIIMNLTWIRRGIYLTYADSNIINDNSLYALHWGIYLDYANNNSVVDNTASRHNYSAIYLFSSNNNLLSNNNLSENMAGWVTKSGGIIADNSSSNRVANNTLILNRLAGIFLSDSSNNNAVENNTVISNTNGIRLDWHSDFNTLLNNTLYSNMVGINSYRSSNISIEGNILVSNFDGIGLHYSSDSNVISNNISDNSYNGITGGYLSNITIKDNVINLNGHAGMCFGENSSDLWINSNQVNSNGYNLTFGGGFGIALSGVPPFAFINNMISDNTISSNYWTGIILGPGMPAVNNTITNNTIDLNGGSGILMLKYFPEANVSGNTITNNSISSNGWLGGPFTPSGISILGPHSNIVASNILLNNTHGIYLENSDNNMLSGNNASYNTNNGIYVFASNNTTVSGGNASFNYNGIFFNHSFNNTITSNFALNNTNDGIKLVVSNYSNVSYNTARYNYIGVHVTSSSNFTIVNNTFTNNTFADEWIDPSSNFLIFANKILSSNIGIGIIQSVNGIILSNLIQFNNYGIYLNSSSNISINDSMILNSALYDLFLEDSNATIFNTTYDREKVKLVNSTLKKIIVVIPAIIDIDPDTLNLKSKGRWITAYIEVPSYDVSKINISTVLLNETVLAELLPTEIGDYDSDGIADLMVKFSRSAVQDIVSPGNVTLSVSGEIDGIPFKGSDFIFIIGFISLQSSIINLNRKKSRTAIVIVVLLILITFSESVYADCIVPPKDNWFINGSTTFCQGTYDIADDDDNGMFVINKNDIVVDCNWSTLNYTGPAAPIGGPGPINRRTPFYANSKQNITIKNCIFYVIPGVSMGPAIRYDSTANSIIANNTITCNNRGGEAIRIYGSSPNNIIINNTVTACPIGLSVGSGDGTYNNTIVGNHISYALSDGVYFPESGDNHKFIGNVVMYSTGRGVALEDSSNNIFADNIIINNGGAGIDIFLGGASQGSHNNTFKNNTFLNNGDCGSVKIRSSYNNTFYFNNLIDDNQACSDVPSNFFNTTFGNYWSDLNPSNFTDSDDDGFYDSGIGWPYSQATGGNVSANVVDYRPCVYKNCVGLVSFHPSNGSYTNSTAVSFSIRSNQKISNVSIEVNGKISSFSPSYCVGTNEVSCSYEEENISQGLNSITINVTDADGISASFRRYFIYDNTSPAITIEAPASTFSDSIILQGTSSDDTGVSRIEISINGGILFNATGTNSWSASISLSCGPNEIKVRATDFAGNVNSSSISVRRECITSGGARMTEVQPWTVKDFEMRYITILDKEKPTVLTFARTEVSAIELKVKDIVAHAYLSVQSLSSLPPNIPPPSSPTYSYLSISVSDRLADKILEAKVIFKVSKSWMRENDIDEGKVTLSRYNESKKAWIPLPTTKKSESETEVSYEASTPGLSIFAITGEKRVRIAQTPTATPMEMSAMVTPKPTPAVTSTVAPTPTPTPKPWWMIPGFESVLALSAMIVAYLVIRRR